MYSPTLMTIISSLQVLIEDDETPTFLNKQTYFTVLLWFVQSFYVCPISILVVGKNNAESWWMKVMAIADSKSVVLPTF